MPATLRQSSSSDPVRTLDGIRPAMVKADLPQSDAVGSSDQIGPVIHQALIQHYGSVKAAAISLGIDPSLMKRELETGAFKLARLEACDGEAKAFIARALYESLGSADPKSIARRMLRDIEARVSELRELIA